MALARGLGWGIIIITTIIIGACCYGIFFASNKIKDVEEKDPQKWKYIMGGCQFGIWLATFWWSFAVLSIA